MKIINKAPTNLLGCGVKARLGYGIFAIFGQYKLSEETFRYFYDPKFTIGIEISIR